MVSDQQRAEVTTPTVPIHATHPMRQVLAHTHSHTLVHSTRQVHTHRTTLLRANPPAGEGVGAVTNTVGVCDELNSRLMGMDSTLTALLCASGAPRAGNPLAGTPDTAAERLSARCGAGITITACMYD
jgi:hypothetical protein